MATTPGRATRRGSTRRLDEERPPRRGAAPFVMLVDKFESYQRQLALRLRERARATGRPVIVVNEGLHEFAAALPADARLLLGAVLDIGRECDPVAGLPALLADRPLACLDRPLDGVPSVASDDRQALRELMLHVTADPQRHRFAFVRGRSDSHESLLRERVFREVLAERGIAVDERMIVRGGCRAARAYRALDAILRDGLRPDAVIAASDTMAAGALHALSRHGLRVPEDTIVTGVDDDVQASLASPPLTTVALDPDARIDAVFERLLARVEGGRDPFGDGHLTRPGRFVPRASTGRAILARSYEPGTGFAARLRAALARGPLPTGVSAAELARLMDEAINGPETEAADVLERRLDGWLRHLPGGALDAPFGRHVQYALDTLVRSATGGTLGESAPAVLSLIHGTINDAIWADVQQRQMDNDALQAAVMRLHLAFGRCSDRVAVTATLAAALPSLGLATAFVALYSGTGHPRPAERARLVLGHRDGRTLELPDEAFPSIDLLPEGLCDEAVKESFVLSALQVGGLHFGYLLTPLDMPDGLPLAGVVQSLANALQSCCHRESTERRAREMSAANADLARLAGRDALTGLPNRAGFLELLDRRLHAAEEEHRGLSLLFCDLDGFKAVNDTHGHAAGDRLLRVVAARVRRRLRRGDTVARLGGDEFTVVIDEACADGAAVGATNEADHVAEALLGELSRAVRIDGHDVAVSASIGIARFPQDARERDALLRHADTAMYRAKADGRNRHARYCPSLERHALDRVELDRSLRQALGAGELSLHWQPRVALDTDGPIGFEALLRWNASARLGRDVGPAEFVPLAERSGFVRELDAFAFDAACAELAGWRRQGHEVAISINLSTISLASADLAERVARSLARHGVPGDRIELEIAESAALREATLDLPCQDALRALGLRFSIERFGLQASSLRRLQRLPIGSLKIDPSLVAGLDRGDATAADDLAVIRAVVALARELGYRVIAEGVERDTQLAPLRSAGCHEAQGWLFGRAEDSSATARRLGTRSTDARAA